MTDYKIPGSLLNIIFKSVEDQLGERGLKDAPHPGKVN